MVYEWTDRSGNGLQGGGRFAEIRLKGGKRVTGKVYTAGGSYALHDGAGPDVVALPEPPEIVG